MRLLSVLFALFLVTSPLLAIGHHGSQNAAAESLPTWTRVFHLHEGVAYVPSGSYDWLNSSGPANPPRIDYDGDGVEGITLRKAGQPHTQHAWILYPEVGSNVSISGDMNVLVWARGVDNTSGIVMVARFYDIVASQWSSPQSGYEIGNATLPLVGPDYSVLSLYLFTIVGVAYTLPTNHFLALTIERQDSDNNRLVIYFDKTDYDSYISLDTSTSVNVSSAHMEDSSGSPRTVFSDQENAIVDANVTDPFGTYDVVGVAARVLNGSTVVVPATPMGIVQSDASVPGYWIRYNLSLPLLPAGSYIVNVTASDPQGIPTWQNLSLTILGVDHFNVSAPSSIVARALFSMTVSARDSSDSIMTNWVGTVQLAPYESDMSTNGTGLLARTALTFSTGDSGVVTIPDQSYTFGEETILIRASSGPHLGWSDPIIVSSGPVVRVDLSPPGPETVISGSSVVFTAAGFDSFGNQNTTWSPNWTVPSTIGDTTILGFSATFVASLVGSEYINCRNDLTDANQSALVEVVAGGLASIIINAPANPLVISEGGSQALTATGYDVHGNIVDFAAGASWSTNTSGRVVGNGSSATYTAGFVPEVGIIGVRDVRVGSVMGVLDVEVVAGLYGPWLDTIPVQIQNEDVGTWQLSLTGYWHDDNSTELLAWSVEDVNTSLYFITHDSTANSVLKFTSQIDQSGQDEFTLWVVDRDGYWTYQRISVNIVPVNDAPKFVNGPPNRLYVRYDEPYSFDYTYYVSDVDNARSELRLSAVMSSSSEGTVNFDGLIATFLFPSDPGRGSTYFEIVTIAVADLPGAFSEMKLVVYVTDDHPPRLNASLPDVTLYEGEILHYCFNLDTFFYDIDSSYLYFTFGFHHIQIFIAWNHSVYVNASEEWSGTTDGTFTATDPEGAIKMDTVTVTVIAVNDPPIVQMPGSVIVKHNVTYYLYLSQYVWDPDNSMESLTITFNDTRVKHTSSFMGSHRLEILYPGSLPDSETYLGPYLAYVHMEVTDPSGLMTPCDFTVLVTDNTPPTVIASNPDVVYFSFSEDSYLNNSMKLYDLFRDSDDATLNFTITGNSHVHLREYSNGVVNLSADVNWSGTEVLSIIARDPHLGWASLRAYVTVTEVNDAPWIQSIPNMIMRTGRIDAPFYILSYITDSDDGPENLTITASPAENVAVVGGYLYVTLPHGVDVITVTIQASDGTLQSNIRSFNVGVSKTMAERIGWPYSFPLVLLAAGVAGYFLASRIPRPYALENIFLIHNDGRLVAHVSKEDNTNLDKDVVSAMFTAVQEFVKDSFQKGEVGLKKLEIGDKKVTIEKGQSAYLALIYSGWPAKETFESLPMLMRDVEERYKGRLEKWNGTVKTVRGVDKMLQEFMADMYRPGMWHEEEELEEAQWVDILEKEA
jgi:hypothetical protein